MSSTENENTTELLSTKSYMLTKSCSVIKKISVEPLLFVSLFVIVMYSIISQQFIYQQFSVKYGLDNVSKSSACNSNVSNETLILQNKVSAETSTWVFYLNIAGFIPSFFCTVIIGAWGDLVGRKPVLLLGFIGLFIMIAVYILVVQLNLHVSFLLIARICAGITGDFNSILASSYAYLSDSSSHKHRTVRIALGEASTGIGGLIASVVSGIWIDAKGFKPPLWMLLIVLIISIFYIIFSLSESKPTLMNENCYGKLKLLFSCRSFYALHEFLTMNYQQTLKILGIAFCFFLQLTIHDGVGDTIIVYELSPPLCWSSLLIGFGSAIRDSAYLFGIAFLKFFSHFTDFSFILISSASTVGSSVLYAFAFSTWIMFVGYSFSILRTVSATVLRSMVSRLVGRNQLGSCFAVIACAESLSSLLGSLLFNEVYSATVSDARGAVFLMGAGFQVLFVVLSWFAYRYTKVDLVVARNEEHNKLLVSPLTENDEILE